MAEAISRVATAAATAIIVRFGKDGSLGATAREMMRASAGM